MEGQIYSCILEVYMTGILRRKAQLKTPSTIHNGQLYCQNMNDIKQLAKRYSLQYTGKTIEENLKQAYERVLEEWHNCTLNTCSISYMTNCFPMTSISFISSTNRFECWMGRRGRSTFIILPLLMIYDVRIYLVTIEIVKITQNFTFWVLRLNQRRP